MKLFSSMVHYTTRNSLIGPHYFSSFFQTAFSIRKESCIIYDGLNSIVKKKQQLNVSTTTTKKDSHVNQPFDTLLGIDNYFLLNFLKLRVFFLVFKK